MIERLLKRPIRLLLINLCILAWIGCLVITLKDIPVHKADFSIFIAISAVIIVLLLPMFTKENKYDKLLLLLYHDCYPSDYIREARYLLNLEQTKERSRDENMLEVLLSTGLYAAGKFQEAKEILDSIKIVYHYKNAAFLANYFHRRFLISLEIERYDTSWGYLGKMRKALEDIKNHKSQQMFTRMYNEDMHILNMTQGDYEGAETVFKDMFNRGRTNYERSFASFLLGGLYKRLGREAEAKDAYKYVLMCGNKLYIADKAAEILGPRRWRV